MLPDNPSDRRAYILAAATAPGAILPDFFPIDLTSGAHTARIWMWGDALTIDGTRVGVTARMAQAIADAHDALLPTSLLADALYIQRGTLASPHPQPYQTISTTAAMVACSDQIDHELAQAGEPVEPFQTVGKHWILSQKATAERAVNYGWHVPSWKWNNSTNREEWAGIPVFACASLMKDASGNIPRVIQPPSTAHNYDHDDNSQTLILVRRECLVDDESWDLVDVLTDTALCNLVSCEGVLAGRLPI